MAQPQVIISQQGPLPITVTVQTGSVGPATLVVAGSVWSPTANVDIGMSISMDGALIGNSTIYSNGPDTHRTTVPMHLLVTLDKPFTGDPPDVAPTYTFELTAANGNTASDENDFYQVLLLA